MARPISAEIPTNTLEGRKAYMKDWWAKNKDKKKAYDAGYYSRHKAECSIRSKKYYSDNQESIRAWNRQYAKDNKEKLLPMWRKHYHKRRATLAGVDSEPYTKDQIFNKSNGMCHICRLAIDLDLKWPNPLSFSYDHIIALSRGGSDLIDNIEAAHLRCNISKYVNPVRSFTNG